MVPESQIGKQIKAIRLSQNLTLESLAEKTGFTKGYLSKVENAEKAPPVSTLIVIAKALNATLSSIFGEEPTTRRFSLVKRKARQMMARDGETFGYTYETLAHHDLDKKMEPYILTIPASSTECAVFQHEGEEMILVLEGTMRFRYGEEEHLVETGDCVYFDSAVPHACLPADHRDVRCVMVIYVP